MTYPPKAQSPGQLPEPMGCAPHPAWDDLTDDSVGDRSVRQGTPCMPSSTVLLNDKKDKE